MELRRRRTAELSHRDRSVLDLERRYGSAAVTASMKFDEAQRELGLTPAGYSLILKALVDDPAAEAYDAETVGRLRAARAAGEKASGSPRF